MMQIDLKNLSYTVTLDDDPVIGKIIEGATSMKTFIYASAKALMNDIALYTPLGVFVDIHLTGDESGLEIIPQLRETWPDAPIIVITSDPEHSLVASALQAGADDFIRKPLDDIEVRARLNARLAQLSERRGNSVLQFGDAELDVIHKTITGPKGRQLISNREVSLLAQLIKAKGLVLSKAALKKQLWAGMAISDNALDRKIFEVRKLLRAVTDSVELKSIYGEGLKLQKTTHESDSLLLDDFDVFRRTRTRASQQSAKTQPPVM